jgi:hypothetical protein
MAHQMLVEISSDSSEYVEEEDVGSPLHSDAGNSLQFPRAVPFLGPLYQLTLSQSHIVSARRGP